MTTSRGGAEVCYTAPGPSGAAGVLAELECGHLGPRPVKVNGKLTRSTCCRWCTNEWKAGRLKIEETPKVPEAAAEMVEVLAILRGMSTRLTALEDAATKPPVVLNGTSHLEAPAES